MRNILNIIVHDFRRLTASVVALVILMGIVVVPCLFAWLNILSNWDPFEPESTGKVPVAVVNCDEGSEMLGLEINVGEKFIDAVNGNDMIGWTILRDPDKAVEAVRAGDYYAAVVVPEDFSDQIMSFTTGTMEHPKILFYENEKTNAIAPKIADKVRDTLKEEIDDTFVDTLGSYITEAANAAEAAGLDPQDAFSDLSDTMTDLSADLESSIAMVQAFAGLSEAAEDLLQASDDLMGSSESTLDLGEQLLEAEESRIPEKIDTTSVEEVIDELTSLLSKDLTKIDSDLSAVRDDMGKYNSFVQNKLGKYKTTVSDMKQSTDKIAKKLKDMGLTGLSSRFARISEKLAHIQDRLDKFETADASNWASIQGYIDEILTDVEFANQSIVKINADVDNELDTKLNQAVSDARKAIAKTRGALSGIYGDMELLEDALEKSDSSLETLEDGFDGTAATLLSLQNGCRNLAELFDRFSDSDILQDVNHLMTNDAEVIAENMATPIKMKSEQIYPIDHFGSVMAPFYTTIAQWIGAMFAAVMIRVQIKEREGLENVRLGQRFLGRYRLFMMIGLAQALLVSLGELLYVGIQCIHPLLFILAACVNSVVFTLIVYSFVFAFENVGLAIGVVMMIIQVAGGGGTFPMEVLPPVFRVMYPFMPFHYAMDAMRECIGGMYGSTYIRCLGALILCGLVAAAIGLLLHKPMKKTIEKVEESKRESDVML